MDILPSTEMIQKIASIHFLQQQVGDRVDTLVGSQEEKQWQYEVIGKGMHTTTYRITLGKEKFALKISDNEKFTRDTELESWLRDEHGQNTPQIFSHGRGRLPGMEGEYFWSIQEYISGPRWRDSTMNDAQLDSYITQLGSLHQIKHNGTKGWGEDPYRSQWSIRGFLDIYKKIDGENGWVRILRSPESA